MSVDDPPTDSRGVRTRVTRTFTFDAAHRLPAHAGACARLHGHTYRLEVTVAGALGGDGMVIDFCEIKAATEEHVLNDFDHGYLNDVLANPTAELIAHEIVRRLRPHLDGLSRVRLWETQNSLVEVDVVDAADGRVPHDA